MTKLDRLSKGLDYLNNEIADRKKALKKYRDNQFLTDMIKGNIASLEDRRQEFLAELEKEFKEENLLEKYEIEEDKKEIKEWVIMLKVKELLEDVEEMEKILEEKQSLINTINSGFTITEQGKKSVIAKREVAPELQKYKGKVEYVSWAYHITEEGTPSYYWGKYTDNYKQAKEVMEGREENLS